MRIFGFIILAATTISTAESPQKGTLADFVGINSNAIAYETGIVERLAKTARWIREYHRWEWYEQTPNVYTWDAQDSEHEGVPKVHHTEFVKACVKNKINLLICNERTAVWASTHGKWNNPPYGDLDGSIEDHYIDKAEFIAQQVARYGSRKIDGARLQTQDKLSGLDVIHYYEDDNEPDQWWWKPTWPAEKYAKYLNAVHDGYGVTPRQDYPLIGIKNVDPNAVHVLGGMNGDEIEYLDRILASTDGRIPFDVLNFHHYCSTSLQDSMGICPEHDEYGFRKTVEMWVNWRDRHLPGMPIWCTEFGWDTYQNPNGKTSYIYAPEESQANYLLRSLFVFMHYGIEKAFVFYDVDPNTGNAVQFSTSGILSDAKSGLHPKVSFYYLATLQNLVADYTFIRSEKYGEGHPAVYAYQLKSPESEKKLCYVLYCRDPDSRYDDGTHIKNFILKKGGIVRARCIEPVDLSEHGREVPVSLKHAGRDDAQVLLPLLSEKPVFLFVEME